MCSIHKPLLGAVKIGVRFRDAGYTRHPDVTTTKMGPLSAI